MTEKIEEMIYWVDMGWYNLRDRFLNRIARWCMLHAHPEYPTILTAVRTMTDPDLHNMADRVTAWRARHPDKNYWEIF